MPVHKQNQKLNELKEENKLTFIDLFCGIGGFHQALKEYANCVFACDLNKYCRETYFNNYGLHPEGDITKVDEKNVPTMDIITAGFPCQSFSNAGKKKNFSDKRGMLFEHILRIAAHKKPKFMFLENVKHIKRINKGESFKYILKRIRETGYVVDEKKTVFDISPHHIGIPQNRERVIFVCIRKDLYKADKNITPDVPLIQPELKFTFETDVKILKKYKIKKELLDVLNIWDKMIKVFAVGEKLSPTILCNEFYRKEHYSAEQLENLPKWKKDYMKKNEPIYNKYKEHWDAWYAENKTLLSKREVYGKLEWQTGKKKENDSIFNHFIQIRQSGIRVKRSTYFPTLVAIVQTPIYGKEKRYITPRECARLQSFPEDFKPHEKDNVAYKQFGNSVNVEVIKLVIKKVLNVYGYI